MSFAQLVGETIKRVYIDNPTYKNVLFSMHDESWYNMAYSSDNCPNAYYSSVSGDEFLIGATVLAFTYTGTTVSITTNKGTAVFNTIVTQYGGCPLDATQVMDVISYDDFHAVRNITLASADLISPPEVIEIVYKPLADF